MKKYSIKDIAQMSGVSVATVSRVINNNGRFSEDTKKRVLEVIQETGYQTNINAKGLRMNRSYTIGIIVPDITNYFFAKLTENIEGHLFEKGYSTIICNTSRDTNKENSYLEMLENKSVDGLIIISGARKFSFTNEFSRSIPYICIDREPHDLTKTTFISSDHQNGAVLATDFLFEKKCQYPLIVTNPKLTSTGKKRLKGFKSSLKTHGLVFKANESHYKLDLNKENSSSDLVDFLKENPKIDGIFAINDLLAVEVQNSIIYSSLDINNYKLIGFDDTPFVSKTVPQISSIRQNIPEIAKLSVEKVLHLLKHTNDLGKTYTVPVELVER